MAKRRTSPQQRRQCPSLPRPGSRRKAERQPSAGRPAPGLLRSKRPLPRLPASGDLSGLFGDKTLQQSFADLMKESLSDQVLREDFGEKQAGRRPRLAEILKTYPPPQAELDLHGATGPEAAGRIEALIRNSRGQGLRTLRIITGKGLHSQGPAVLPEVAEHTLLELKERQAILAFRWERKRRERSGAVLVYLP